VIQKLRIEIIHRNSNAVIIHLKNQEVQWFTPSQDIGYLQTEIGTYWTGWRSLYNLPILSNPLILHYGIVFLAYCCPICRGPSLQCVRNAHVCAAEPLYCPTSITLLTVCAAHTTGGKPDPAHPLGTVVIIPDQCCIHS